MTKILLIRHALTDSVGKYLSGRAPGLFLNDTGRHQSQLLAVRLSTLPVSAIYSSPLERALETAGTLAKSLNLPVFEEKDFLEIDFGEWTNKTFAELNADREFQLFNSFRSKQTIPGGEHMRNAQSRIINGLEKLHAKHPDQTIAVISHADLIKSAIAYYAGIHLDMFHRIEISPASVSIIDLYDETARILLLNDTGSII